MKFLNKLFIPVILFTLASCGPEEPEAENEEEIITDFTLTFTPTGGTPIVVTAQDPDGEGPQDIQVNGSIDLAANTDYSMEITIENSIAGEDITSEVSEEADEHMFFFSWTEGLFSDPAGDGNIDNRADAVNYDDSDVNQQPLGLATSWTTGSAGSGTFRVVLKHQPGLKNATSTVTDGESDIDLSYTLNIQ